MEIRLPRNVDAVGEIFAPIEQFCRRGHRSRIVADELPGDGMLVVSCAGDVLRFVRFDQEASVENHFRCAEGCSECSADLAEWQV